MTTLTAERTRRVFAGVVAAICFASVLGVAAGAHACTCGPDPAAKYVRTFPDDGVDVPPNGRFWVWMPIDPARVKARVAAGDTKFTRRTCPPGDPLCGEGDEVGRSPRTAGAAKHPGVVWPEPLPPLRPFLWRWPEGGDPTAHTVVAATIRAPAAESRWDVPWEVIPAAPLVVGERYAIAIGPTAELSFPWAAFHARGAPDVVPPKWDGPRDPKFDDAKSMNLGTCGDGGRIVSGLSELSDASYAYEAGVLLLLEQLVPVGGHFPKRAPFLAKVTPPRLVFGIERACEPPLIATPHERPFTVRITPIDAASNRGRPYRLTLQADGRVMVEAEPGSSPGGERADAVVVHSAAASTQSPSGPPPRLARFGPVILVFIVVFVALRLVWRRHRARSLDRA